MATLMCDICHEEPAQCLVTTVLDGDVTALCGRDTPAYLMAMVTALAPELVTEAAQLMTDPVTDEPSDEPDSVPNIPGGVPPTYPTGDPDEPTHPERGPEEPNDPGAVEEPTPDDVPTVEEYAPVHADA